jgi:hypothetical protein
MNAWFEKSPENNFKFEKYNLTFALNRQVHFVASIGARLQARLEPETHNQAADYYALSGNSCNQIISFSSYYQKK